MSDAETLGVQTLVAAVDRLTAAVEHQAERPRIGRRSQPRQFADPLTIALFQRLLQARVPIRRVPAPFFEERGDLVLLACRCRRAHRVFTRAPYYCKCGRIFLHTGTALFSANTDQPRS